MALIQCPKCGKAISDKAKRCVGCGWEANLSILNEKKASPNFGETILESYGSTK